VLVTDPDGTITWPSEKGLFFLDTRIISNWSIYANGEPWQLLNGGPIDPDGPERQRSVPTRVAANEGRGEPGLNRVSDGCGHKLVIQRRCTKDSAEADKVLWGSGSSAPDNRSDRRDYWTGAHDVISKNCIVGC
jgi:hypothetical protein